MSTSGDMTEQEIWQELVRFTGNEYAAAGIMGNLKAESNLNSSNLQNSYETSLRQSDSTYTSAVDNGTYNNFVHDSAGYGLAQWTYHSRKENLLNYARQTGQSIGSTRMQLSFLEKELEESYGGVLSALKNSKSVKEASDIMITQYERPANQSSSAKNTRANYSNNFYNQYNGTAASTTGLDFTSSVASDPTSAGLSDETLELQPDNINDICTQWQSKILASDISSIDVTSVFSPLTNAGVGTTYIPSLKTALSRAESLILSVSNTIQQTVNEQTGVDQQYQNQDLGTSYIGNYSGGGGRSKKKEKSDNIQANIPEIGAVQLAESITTEVDNTTKNVTINTEFVDKVNKLNEESYIKFMTELGSITKGDLLGYITDTENASKLKKVLLDSANIDADLKKLISNMDENEVQVTLQSILTDKNIITDASKNIIYSYTESLSNDTNLTILKVTKEIQFFNQVDDIFNSISTLISKENLQENVLSIYDGNEVKELSPSTISFVKLAIDKIAESKKITYEDLLTDKNNEEIVKTTFNDLAKALSYFRTINTMGTDASQLLYKNVMEGVS